MQTPEKRSQSKRLFLLGVLFEVALIGIYALEPNGSWFFSEIRWGAMLVNLPLFIVLQIFGENFLLLPIGLAGIIAMGFLWSKIFGLVWYWKTVLSARLTNRQKLITKCALCALGIPFLAVEVFSALPQTPRVFASAAETKPIVDSNTAFALDLYQSLKDQPGNLFFSPYSISSSLAMTSAGAHGQTETEMRKTLHFSQPSEQLHSLFGVLNARLDKLPRWGRIELGTANSLWGQTAHPIKDGFLEVVRSDYGSQVRRVDFNNAEGTRHEINSWVNQSTHGKIQDLVQSGQLTPLTRMVLCNTIYFKGKWQNQFKTSDTKPAEFHINTNKTVTLPMMRQEAEFKMKSSADHLVKMVELPYVGKDLSMIILLPAYYEEEGGSTLPEIEDKLTVENLNSWLSELDRTSPEKLWVYLPRFTATRTFDLTKELKALGMPSVFDSTADFSGIDGTPDVFISDVLHKAFVKVNEEGTEAAAATWISGKAKGKDEAFAADRPFIFLIRENGSGSILFLGRFVDPENKYETKSA